MATMTTAAIKNGIKAAVSFRRNMNRSSTLTCRAQFSTTGSRLTRSHSRVDTSMSLNVESSDSFRNGIDLMLDPIVGKPTMVPGTFVSRN